MDELSLYTELCFARAAAGGGPFVEVARFAPSGARGHSCSMRPHFLAFRRTLPGGMIVLVSLEADKDGLVHGVLQVERRVDPERQQLATAPVLARASGHSKDDVLRQLRALAENDSELAAQITAWELAHPSHRKPGERY
jgi:hypothetical protein